MVTVLITGSDTGVGKTLVVGSLARFLHASGKSVQIVKVLETGRPTISDAEQAAKIANLSGLSQFITLESFPEPLAPISAAAAAGRPIDFDALVARVNQLQTTDWRLLEGAGGIATQVAADGRDWADFGAALDVDAAIIVVPDRLGAVNQGRLAYAQAVRSGLRAGIWLNESVPVTVAVAASNRMGLEFAGVPLWAEQGHDAVEPRNPLEVVSVLGMPAVTDPIDSSNGVANDLERRCGESLEERQRRGLLRTVRVSRRGNGELNLADNDYLGLARDPAVASAVAEAAETYGTSASASALITGWGELHEALLGRLCTWHGFPTGLIWTSGFAANSAVLGVLPRKGDLVLADRLIHASMIAGILRSGARLRRFEHLNLDQLEGLLAKDSSGTGQTFVVTESVFSMDGDIPDLKRLARLKAQYGFCLVLDEAHALGWYGPEGAGMARKAGIEVAVDILIGTFGKALASGGAYTLFRSNKVRDYLVNEAGEFIYSTALPPTSVAAAMAAIEQVRILSAEQASWHKVSREFRSLLREQNWEVPAGDSPIVPVRLDSAGAAVALATWLNERGILVSAVRPPTVPEGTSRLRLSLKREFGSDQAERVLGAMNSWRERT